MLFASVGFATTISNYSFENLPVGGLPEDCGGGCVSGVGEIPGWTFSEPNTSGQAQPGAQLGNFTYVNSIPDGITVAFSNLATISQTVGVVQLGVFYSLSVDVGLIKTFGALGSVELLIGNNAPIIATGLVPPEGDWSTYMATYVGLVGDVGRAAVSLQEDFEAARSGLRRVALVSPTLPVPTSAMNDGAQYRSPGKRPSW